jgi:predicted unusual protein kinase regulating ubiquinone biosynthesis (AarF/ABC1/UbiB family)
MVPAEKCRSIRLAPELLHRAKCRAMVLGCLAQDDEDFSFIEVSVVVSAERQVPSTSSGQAVPLRRATDAQVKATAQRQNQKQNNRRSIRLASELLHRAKCGAMIFGCFAQDDGVFSFVGELC